MRRKLMLATGALLAVVSACASSGDGVRSDSGPEARDTPTTEAGERTKKSKEGAPTATEAPPAAPSISPFLAVVGTVQVPDGEPGKLSVVLTGSPNSGGSVPVVVRNRTDDTVYSIEASATARAADGSLAGSGSSQGFVPTTVAPGEWSFGYVYFGGELPADATYDVTATGETDSGLIGGVDVEPVETNVVPSQYTGQQVVGIVANESTKEVSGPVSVSIICFDAAGTAITGTHGSYTDADTIAAGGTASFSIDLFDDPCINYAVGASGYDF